MAERRVQGYGGTQWKRWINDSDGVGPSAVETYHFSALALGFAPGTDFFLGFSAGVAAALPGLAGSINSAADLGIGAEFFSCRRAAMTCAVLRSSIDLPNINIVADLDGGPLVVLQAGVALSAGVALIVEFDSPLVVLPGVSARIAINNQDVTATPDLNISLLVEYDQPLTGQGA